MSKKYTLDKNGLKQIVKVIGYAGSSAIIVSLIGILPDIDVPSNWIWAVPVINILLVAIKKFFTEDE